MADDYRYFKFRTIDKHFIESIVSPSLYFSTPSQLNDPFDCRLNLQDIFAKASEAVSGSAQRFLKSAIQHPSFLSDFNTHFDKIGICAFSLDGVDPLLWAHYAAEHRGVRLLYNIPAAFLDDGTRFIGVDTVRYGLEELHRFLTVDTPMEMKAFMLPLLKHCLTTKSPAWRYEAEARVIRSAPGLFSIPRGYLEQICFGLRTEPADIDLVTTLARSYCGCSNFSQMVRGEREFGLVERPL
jgi:hypothetical protein